MAWSAETLAFDRSDAKDAFKAKDARSGASALLEPEVRVNFADTALWLPRSPSTPTAKPKPKSASRNR